MTRNSRPMHRPQAGATVVRVSLLVVRAFPVERPVECTCGNPWLPHLVPHLVPWASKERCAAAGSTAFPGKSGKADLWAVRTL